MAILPATGAEIAFGKVHQAFTNVVRGSAGDAPAGGQNIKLSAVLGANAAYGIRQAAGTQIKFSATFGGKVTPFAYPP